MAFRFGTTLALAMVACDITIAQRNHLPAGRPSADTTLDQVIRYVLPANATQVAQPLPVELGPLGKVQVVLFRRSESDPLFRGIALLPNSGSKTYRAIPLPDEQIPPANAEEITTAILAADIAAPDPDPTVPGGANQGLAQTLPPSPDTAPPSAARTPPAADPTQPTRPGRTEGVQRALVILFYTHRFGQTDSDAFGRVYLYDNGQFRIDDLRSRLLDGVRTAAVARMRLAPAP